MCSELLIRQCDSLITGNYVETEDIFYESDSTNLYKQFLKWRIEQSQIMQTDWSDYKITFLNVDYSKEADDILVSGSFNLKYVYSNGLTGGQDDIKFKAILKKVDNDYLISSINLEALDRLCKDLDIQIIVSYHTSESILKGLWSMMTGHQSNI